MLPSLPWISFHTHKYVCLSYRLTAKTRYFRTLLRGSNKLERKVVLLRNVTVLKLQWRVQRSFGTGPAALAAIWSQLLKRWQGQLRLPGNALTVENPDLSLRSWAAYLHAVRVLSYLTFSSRRDHASTD